MFSFLGKRKTSRIEIKEKNNVEDVDKFIYEWNTQYPIDRWYRKKYGIKFNSPDHRVLSFIDMYIEWKEDKIFNNLFQEKEYIVGDYIEPQKIKEEDKVSNEDLMKYFEGE